MTNFRQQVDQWFARNKQYRYETTYEEKGPQNSRLYQCTYILDGAARVEGDWLSNKSDAKESAAKSVVKILHSARDEVR
jgi:hypothetical protein